MKYTKEMILASESGYCMPFAERDNEVEMTLGYGEQTHPLTGQRFFHHGVDLKARNYPLCAVADGVICGVGKDSQHGLYQVARYGKYEVKYARLSRITAEYGQLLKAGTTVARSGDRLHIEVRYDGEELNPLEFLTMLYANASTYPAGGAAPGDIVLTDWDVHTLYEDARDEIEALMVRWLPDYMDDLQQGRYALPGHTEQTLRQVFTASARRNCFFEAMPSLVNPLGLAPRCKSLVEKVQNLLIGDFLNYLALCHQVYLSGDSDSDKKKDSTRH
jgi:hypothetical protein